MNMESDERCRFHHLVTVHVVSQSILRKNVSMVEKASIERFTQCLFMPLEAELAFQPFDPDHKISRMQRVHVYSLRV